MMISIQCGTPNPRFDLGICTLSTATVMRVVHVNRQHINYSFSYADHLSACLCSSSHIKGWSIVHCLLCCEHAPKII